MKYIPAILIAVTTVLVACTYQYVPRPQIPIRSKPQVRTVRLYDTLPVSTTAPLPEPTPVQEPIPEPVPTGPRVYVARVKVTACSPQDKRDSRYYRKHGYKGARYNICSDYRVFPKGTKFKVPGYMPVSYPGKWWEVDAPGGVVIRRATKRGEPQIDVKYGTEYSADEWGLGGPEGDSSTGYLTVEFILPEGVTLNPLLEPYIIESYFLN